jgi:hypothetical protein
MNETTSSSAPATAVEPASKPFPPVDLSGQLFSRFAKNPDAVGRIEYVCGQGVVLGSAGPGFWILEFDAAGACPSFTQIYSANELRSFVLFRSEMERAKFVTMLTTKALQASNQKSTAGRGRLGTMLAEGGA